MPAEIWTEECRLVRERRTGVRSSNGGAPPERAVGLALSGGGIRSATTSLGVLQALARLDLLPFVDYLSTVSGGGYAGAFLGGLYQRWGKDDPSARSSPGAEVSRPAPAPAADSGHPSAGRPDWARVRRALLDRHGHPVDWLRENGRYLAPNGAGDLTAAAAVVIRNLIAVQLVLAITLIALFLSVNGLRHLGRRALELVPVLEGAWARLLGTVSWWSPVFCVAALLLVLWAFPLGIAYWLVPAERRRGPGDRVALVGIWLLAVVGTAAVAVFGGAVPWPFVLGAVPGARHLPLAIAGGALAAACLLALAEAAASGHYGARSRERPAGRQGQGPRDRWASLRRFRSGAEARNFLTLRLRTALVVSVAVTVFACVDLLGQRVHEAYQAGGVGQWLAAVGGTLVSGALAMQRLAGRIESRTEGRPRLRSALLAAVGVVALVLALLVGTSALAHTLTGSPGWHLPRYVIALVLAWLLTVLFGHTYAFVNSSSLSTLYGARLTRAYLGASNEERRNPDLQALSIQLDGDDLGPCEYRPHEHGGPLHLINVTVNETFGGRSQVEQRDRKGMGMAVGPVGISVGARHHATYAGQDPVALNPTADPPASGFRVFPPGIPVYPSWPTLGQWTAISGAAVSTGLGSRTSLSLSVLLGLFNLRLGHWWRSGVEPGHRSAGSRAPSGLARLLGVAARALPVQAHLFNEILARFPGTSSPDWYLTDGGHFENTGAYELIRRMLPTIVLCDHGADADRFFDDLANLVRKVRVDFGAEVRFLDAADLDARFGPERADNRRRGVLGTLRDLGCAGCSPGAIPATEAGAAAGAPAAPRRYAALARISYHDDGARESMLLVLRPAVLGAEPADVLSYRARNRRFPQQDTSDQFFDEAQWESYRRLGEHMAWTVFSAFAGPDAASQAAVAAGWQPFVGQEGRSA